MKALDTSLLLALLEGLPGSRELLRQLRGEELATTEVNFLELEYLVARGPERHRRSRRDAIMRLRRKITVLPVDARAVEACARRLNKGAETAPPLVSAMLGALEAAGCSELLTHDPIPTTGKWRTHMRRIRLHNTKPV